MKKMKINKLRCIFLLERIKNAKKIVFPSITHFISFIFLDIALIF